MDAKPFILLIAILLTGCQKANDIEHMPYRAIIESFRTKGDMLYWGDKKYEDVNWLRFQLDHNLPYPAINTEPIEAIIFLRPYTLRVRTKSYGWFLSFEGNADNWYVSDPIMNIGGK